MKKFLAVLGFSVFLGGVVFFMGVVSYQEALALGWRFVVFSYSFAFGALAFCAWVGWSMYYLTKAPDKSSLPYMDRR